MVIVCGNVCSFRSINSDAAAMHFLRIRHKPYGTDATLYVTSRPKMKIRLLNNITVTAMLGLTDIRVIGSGKRCTSVNMQINI